MTENLHENDAEDIMNENESDVPLFFVDAHGSTELLEECQVRFVNQCYTIVNCCASVCSDKNAQVATSLLTSCNRLVINKPISGCVRMAFDRLVAS